MGTIFISYRRDDTKQIVGRIHERLCHRFGRRSVFLDFHDVRPGEDVHARIKSALFEARVLLALIGERWLDALLNGERRLDDPNDFLRSEIETALARQIHVIPVLISAKMLAKESLPTTLSGLASRKAVVVDPECDFDHHMDGLIRELEKMLNGGGLAPDVRERVPAPHDAAASAPRATDPIKGVAAAAGAAPAAPAGPAASPRATVFAQLASLVASNRVVVVLGDALDPAVALSREVLAERLSRHAGLPKTDLYAAGTRLEQEHGRRRLLEIALQEIQSVNGSSTPAYQSLATLPVSTVVSLHPDPVLEAALMSRASGFRLFVTDEEMVVLDPKPGKKELFLLHGRVRVNATGLVLTRDDRERLLQRTAHLARGLRDRFALRAILLLGCDLRDLKTRKLLYKLTRHRTSNDGALFVCGGNVPELFRQSRNPVMVDGDPSDLLVQLAAHQPGRAVDPAKATSAGRTIPGGQQTPYMYLDFFEAEHAGLFFGRGDEVQRVASEILSAPRRVTVLCGQSGVGKTSLVKAGLVPHLEELEIITAYARCGQDPERAIADAVRERSGGNGGAGGDLTSARLADVLQECYARDRRLQVIFIDQMEEAFIKLGRAVLDGLAAALDECLADREGAARFVFVIREDFLPQMATLSDRLSGVLSSPCRLEDLSREAARSAIMGPAEQCRVRVEDGLAEAILADLSADKVLPAHLQIVCHQVFRACQADRVMSLAAYQGLGHASAIIRSHLEKAVADVPPGLEAAARSVLRALVTSEWTKDLITLDEIAARTGLDAEVAARANHDLIHRCRLVREVRGKPGFFELSHESLAESVSAWLTDVEAQTRAVQELLDQEVSTGRKDAGHVLKPDRLKLVDGYRASLYLSLDAVRLVIASYVARHDLPDFWRGQADALPAEAAWEALVYRPIRANEMVLNQTLRRRSSGPPWPEGTPPSGVPADVESRLIQWVGKTGPEALADALPFLERLASPPLGRALAGRFAEHAPGDVTRFVRTVGAQIGAAMADTVAEAASDSHPPRATAALAARLFEASRTWPSAAAAVRTKLSAALRALLRSPDGEVSDWANAECAQLALTAPTGEAPVAAPAASELDQAALLRVVLRGPEPLATASVRYLVATRSPDSLSMLLMSMGDMRDRPKEVLTTLLRDTVGLGESVLRDVLQHAGPRTVLIDLACDLFVRRWKADPAAPVVGLLSQALIDAIGRIDDGGPTLRIAKALEEVASDNLVEAFCAAMGEVDPSTGLALLELKWQDWGWVAATVLLRCPKLRNQSQVIDRYGQGVSRMSTRSMVAMVRLGGQPAYGTVRALAATVTEFGRGPEDRQAVVAALSQTRTGVDPGFDVMALWLRVAFGDATVDATAAQQVLLPILELEQHDRLPVLGDVEFATMLNAVDWWFAQVLGLGATGPALPHHRPEPIPEQVWNALRQLTADPDLLIRARASHLLARWGDRAGFDAAVLLLSRSARNRAPNAVLEVCATAVREFAPRLSDAELRSALRKRAIAPLVLSAVLDASNGAELAPEDPGVLNAVLNAFAMLPWPEATELRRKFAHQFPDLVEKLRADRVGRNSNQRYQIDQILVAWGREEHGC